MPSPLSHLFLLLFMLSLASPLRLSLACKTFFPTRLLSTSPSSSSSSPPSGPLSSLRTVMAKASLTAYIVPSDDQHLSEYTHPHYQRRYHLTNFDGSAGTALVTLTDAYLWTDSRYYEQVSERAGNRRKTSMAHVRVWTRRERGARTRHGAYKS